MSPSPTNRTVPLTRILGSSSKVHDLVGSLFFGSLSLWAVRQVVRDPLSKHRRRRATRLRARTPPGKVGDR